MSFIEALESRIAPALLAPLVDGKGVLHIMHDDASGTKEDIVVTQTAANTFQVSDPNAMQTFAPSTGVKSIAILTSTFSDTIDLKFTQDGLTGDLEITTGGGTNGITLETVDFVSGVITGKVKIQGGVGADTVNVFGGLAIASPVTFAGGDGLDAFLPSGAYLAKKLTLDSVENITTANATAPVVIGGMLVEDEDPNGAVSFVLSNIATIAGALTYCGSSNFTDNVTLDGQFSGPVKLMLLDGANNVISAGTFTKGLSATGGSGDDIFLFHSKPLGLGMPPGPPYITANFAGSVALKLGNGTNTVTFQDNSFFAKDVSVTTGTGADTVELGGAYFARNLKLSLGNGVNLLTNPSRDNFVGAGLKYTGGADADTVDLDRLVAGGISIVLGHGANGVSGDARLIGKAASILGGTGVDTIDHGLASTLVSLSAKLGAGADSFHFRGGALAAATLDGGTESDTLTGQTLLPAKSKITSF